MRRLTLTLPLLAALLVSGAAVQTADARPERAPRTKQVERVKRVEPARGLDLHTQQRLAEARRYRDHRILKLDNAMDYEKRRARSRYRNDPRGLKAAFQRLKIWYARYETTIERDFLDTRDRILAEARRNPDRRALALARAERDRALRALAVQEEFEYRRARNKYRGHDLRAAKARLRLHFANKRAAIEARFERTRAEVARRARHGRIR